MWQVPVHFNIAEVCCRRWAQMPDVAHQAAIVEHMDGRMELVRSTPELRLVDAAAPDETAVAHPRVAEGGRR